MPNYKTHLVAGLACFFIVARVTSNSLPSLALPLSLLPAGLLLSLIGSIFPDIDVPSKMQKWFYFACIGAVGLAIWSKSHVLMASIGTGIVFVTFLTHRTITHKPAFLALIALVPTLIATYLLPNHANNAFSLYSYFITGCLSHILLDRLLTRFNKLIGKSRRF